MYGEAFPPIAPDEALLDEFLHPMDISHCRLAKSIDVPPLAGSTRSCTASRRITPDTGAQITKALGMSERFFCELQIDGGLAVEKEELDVIAPPVA